MRTLLASLLLCCVPALAADTNDAAVNLTLACRREMRTVCKPKAGTSPLACLQAHHDELSAACKDALDNLHGAQLPVEGGKGQSVAGCSAEFHKACKGARGEKMKACLKAHRAEFSELCAKIADGASKVKPK